MTGNPRWLDAVLRWLPVAGALLTLGGVAALQRDASSWWALAAVACATAFAGRERWPVSALVVTLLVEAATRLPGADVLTNQFDVIYLLLLCVPALPLVTVASRLPARRSWLALVATIVVTVAVCPDPAWSTVTYSGSALAVAWVLTLGVPSTIALVAWLAGSALLARHRYAELLLERSAALERARVVESAAATAAERARIAREVHDVVTHTVAVMVVQASAAAATWERDPGRARAALLAVEDSGRTAMADLRAMLAALRDDVPSEAAAGVEALPALIEQVRLTGLGAELTVAGSVAKITPATGLSLLRIAQESVTNALRHAHATTIAIDLAVTGDAVRLAVADDGIGVAAAAGPTRDGGRGIPGMRERADGLGGWLDVGPGAGGGTVVAVRAPL